MLLANGKKNDHCTYMRFAHTSSAASATCTSELGKTTITGQRDTTAATVFYFAKTR